MRVNADMSFPWQMARCNGDRNLAVCGIRLVVPALLGCRHPHRPVAGRSMETPFRSNQVTMSSFPTIAAICKTVIVIWFVVSAELWLIQYLSDSTQDSYQQSVSVHTTLRSTPNKKSRTSKEKKKSSTADRDNLAQFRTISVV